MKKDKRIVPNSVNDVSVDILSIIESAVKSVVHGSITLKVQDSRIIQMDKYESVLFGSQMPITLNTPDVSKMLRLRLQEAIKGLEFGSIVISMRDNRITRIDKTEKSRLTDLQGMYGDGI